MSPDRRVAIIGGGICGLSAAYHLLDEGGEGRPPGEVRLYEESDSLGGVIRTENLDGFLLDLGPDALFKGKPAAVELARRLGLEGEIINALSQPLSTLIYQNGKLHPLPEGLELMAPTKIGPLLTSRLLSPAGKLRMMMEPFVPRFEKTLDESIAQFARRRFGEEALRKIAGPLMAGIHAGDPEQLSIASTFPRLVEMERKHGSIARAIQAGRASRGPARRTGPPSPPFQSFRKGMRVLVEALAGSLRSRAEMKVGTRVTGLRKNGSGYIVEYGDGSSWEAGTVIVAIPAAPASRLLESMDPTLAGEIAGVPYVSTAAVYMGFRQRPGFKLPPSTGLLVPADQHDLIFGCSFVSQKFGGRAPEGHFLLRLFMGGALHEKAVEAEDAQLVARAREFVSSTLGLNDEPVLDKVQRWTRSNPQYVVGHEARVRRVQDRVQSHAGLHVTGSALMGVGVPDGVALGAGVARAVRGAGLAAEVGTAGSA